MEYLFFSNIVDSWNCQLDQKVMRYVWSMDVIERIVFAVRSLAPYNSNNEIRMPWLFVMSASKNMNKKGEFANMIVRSK